MDSHATRIRLATEEEMQMAGITGEGVEQLQALEESNEFEKELKSEIPTAQQMSNRASFAKDNQRRMRWLEKACVEINKAACDGMFSCMIDNPEGADIHREWGQLRQRGFTVIPVHCDSGPVLVSWPVVRQ